MKGQKEINKPSGLGKQPLQPKNKNLRSFILWLLIMMGFIYLYRMGNQALEGPPRKLSYTEFYQMVSQNKETGAIKSAIKSEGVIEGKLSTEKKYIVNVPTEDEALIAVLRENVQDFYIKSTRYVF